MFRRSLASLSLLFSLLLTGCAGTLRVGVEQSPTPDLAQATLAALRAENARLKTQVAERAATVASTPQSVASPTALPTTPVPTATTPAPTQTAALAQTMVPTSKTVPTLSQVMPTVPSTQPPTTALSPTQPPAQFTRVLIFLVALEDDGQSGKRIGCGDSVVPVQRDIAPTRAPLRAALDELLSLHEQYYGESGLYNALYQSRLRVERAVIEQGEAQVYLVGELRLGGTCDVPRFEAQLKETALQFATVERVSYWINGRPLEEILSQA